MHQTPADQHLHHQAADICKTKQQTSSSISGPAPAFSVAADQIMQHHSSPRATKLLGLSSALQGHIDPPPQLTKDQINLEIDQLASATYTSTSSTVSRYLTIRASLTTCTKHRDTDLQNSLSPRTFRQPSLRLSTATTFNTTDTTQTLYNNSDLHPCTPFVYDSLNKDLAF